MKSLNEIIPFDLCLNAPVAGGTLIAGVTNDSRLVGPGMVFFAQSGSHTDGRDHLQEAEKKGAVAFVAEGEVDAEFASRTILVSSVRKAYAAACGAWFEYPSRKMNLVGVTGTNGKTTVTHLLYQMWMAMGHPAGLIGTVMNRIGDQKIPSHLTTPDPKVLQELLFQTHQQNIIYAAMEVSSIALHQERAGSTRFAAGVFTNLTQDHLDYHGTLENYFDAKKKFFTEHEVGWAILNSEDSYGQRLSQELTLPICTFSTGTVADFFAKDFKVNRNGIVTNLCTPEGEFSFSSPLIGRHNLSNFLAALAVGHCLGFSVKKMIEPLSRCSGAPGRLERVAGAANRPSVFVDYAHTPDALENVLKALKRVRGDDPGKIICVFGCGGDRDRTKRPVMAKIAERLADVIILTSDNPRTEDPQTILKEVFAGLQGTSKPNLCEVDRRKAIHAALELAEPEDFVLVAGKGHEDYQIIGKEKFPFDDAAVIREYYVNY